MTMPASAVPPPTGHPAERLILFYSSLGHGLMHLMTAFYSVIVIALARSWELPAHELLALLAPATILLGVGSLPAGWLGDRWGAPGMIVVMFFGLGISSILCGLVPERDTLALSAGLAGIGLFGAIYHSVGIGWVIRTAREQGYAMGVNGLYGSIGLALYGIVPGILISLWSWRAAFIVPGVICLLAGGALLHHWRTGAVGDRPMPATSRAQPGRAEFWRVFAILSVTMFVEGVGWQVLMYGSGLLLEGRFAPEIAGLRGYFGAMGYATEVVLWVGLATSVIFILSGIAQYVLGRRVVDTYPLKATYVAAAALQIGAMLAMATGNGFVALLGATASAIFSAVAGPIENLLIARYTPSRHHGLGFGAKFVVAFGAGPLAVWLISFVHARTGSLDALFLGLAGAACVVFLVALLLPGGGRRESVSARRRAHGVPAE